MKKFLFLVFTFCIFQSNAYQIKNCTDEDLLIVAYKNEDSSHAYKYYLASGESCIINEAKFKFLEVIGKFSRKVIAFGPASYKDEILELCKDENNDFRIRQLVRIKLPITN